MTSVPPEEAKADAISRFQAPGSAHINCAQAVLDYALLRLGEDPEGITKVKYFGGGFSGMGELCGALGGLVLALGVRDLAMNDRGIEPPADTQDAVRAVIRDFADEFGAPRCADLTGHDLSTAEGMTAFKMSDIRDRCTDYVAWAIDRLEPLLTPALED